jgi:alkanesulfonate monooxygenase SsuD/methylene tetrahydromethanopterin reductase-like flavin-dependent oxidoreductase (luciferase family)
MKIPEYVTVEEVQRVCRALGFRDWTELTSVEVTAAEAELLQKEIGAEAQQIPLEEFRKGLEVELEHGLVFPEANVTNNHPILTGRIVLAHLKEMLDYYSRLEVAELEGDMLKASLAGNPQKVAEKYRKWIAARYSLSQWETERAGKQ